MPLVNKELHSSVMRFRNLGLLTCLALATTSNNLSTKTFGPVSGSFGPQANSAYATGNWLASSACVSSWLCYGTDTYQCWIYIYASTE